MKQKTRVTHKLGFSIGIFSMRTSGKCVKKKFSYIAFLLTALQRKEGIYMVSDCLFDSLAQKALVLDMFTD